MGMVISHNLPSLHAQNMLSANVAGLSGASEKLSSGYRINRSADDAAGLAVSEKMRSQIRGLNQSLRNAQDAVSYIQTAEGALNSIHSLLQRGKELSLEAANGTYDNSTDRAAIQLEIDQICREINDEAMTDYNGKYVFDTNGASPPDGFGNFAKSQKIEGVIIGEGKEATVVTYGAIIGLDVGKANGFSEGALTDYVAKLKDTYLPKMLGGIVGAFPQSAKPTIDGMTIGFKFFNNEDSSTLAYVSSNGDYFNLSVNLKYLTESSGKIDMTPDMNTTIAHEMTHAVMFDVVSAGMLGYNTDKFPDWFVEGMAQSVGGAMNYVSEILPYGFKDASSAQIAADSGKDLNGVLTFLNIHNPSVSEIETYLKKLTTNKSDSMMPYEQGYLATMYLGWLAGGQGTVSQAAIAKGLDKVLLKIAEGNSIDSVIKDCSIYGGLEDFQNKFGDVASVNFVRELISASGAKRAVECTPNNGGISFSAGDVIGGTGSVISPNGLSGDKSTLLNISTTSTYFELYPDSEYGNNLSSDLNVPYDKIYEGGGSTQSGTPSTHTNPGGTTDPDPGPGPTKPDPDPGPDDPDPDDPNPEPDNPNNPNNPGNPNKPGGNTGKPGSNSGWGQSEVPGLKPGNILMQVGAGSRNGIVLNFSYSKEGIGNLNNDFCCTALGLGLVNGDFTGTESAAVETRSYALRAAGSESAGTTTTTTSSSSSAGGFTSQGTISVSTQKDANGAVDVFNFAINKVSMMRASYGAVQNRLEHKINNLRVSHENITSAESQIRDTDMAGTMLDFTKYQILQNASQSILTQCNQMPQGFLSLLS